jgi:hypothetical protein
MIDMVPKAIMLNLVQ